MGDIECFPQPHWYHCPACPCLTACTVGTRVDYRIPVPVPVKTILATYDCHVVLCYLCDCTCLELYDMYWYDWLSCLYETLLLHDDYSSLL